jgi:hypothetical protein
VCNDRTKRNASFQRKLFALLLFIFTSVSCGGPMTEDSHPPLQIRTSDSPEYVAGEYIVTVQPGGDKDTLRQLYSAYGVSEISDLGSKRFLIKLKQDPGLKVIKQKSLESVKVKSIQPNFIYRLNRS